MPQFDITMYTSQIFWLILNITLLIIFNYYYLFSRVKNIIKQRVCDNKQISNKIEDIMKKNNILQNGIVSEKAKNKETIENMLFEALKVQNNKMKILEENERKKITEYINATDAKLTALNMLCELYKSKDAISEDDINILLLDFKNKNELKEVVVKSNTMINLINVTVIKKSKEAPND